VLESTITFDDLRITIAGKLNRYPGLVQIHYRLDTDKVNQGPTCILNDTHHKMFVDRMRRLIVPQRLSSGNISKRHLKEVQVLFEDTSEDVVAKGNGGGTSKGSKVAKTSKQVCRVQSTRFCIDINTGQ
jgi:hypothetical protein